MFYFRNWERLCRFIVENNKKSMTLSELRDNSLLKNSGEHFVCLKHDVEGSPYKALRLAEIEAKYGLSTTYYVQAYLMEDSRFDEVFKKIQSFGHEVSYHYDVLDACNGDFDAAKILFEEKLQVFNKKGFTFRTICQHGNPVKERIGYTSNRDFWRREEIKRQYDFADVVVDFKEITRLDYLYVSDAGYRWNIIDDPENNDRNPDAKNTPIGGFKGLEKLIAQGENLIISTHPHRWQETKFKNDLHIALFRIVRPIALLIKDMPVLGSIMNRFYYLAKKI